jgi:4-aminobutyrate aminotransferase-like enzyme
MNNFKDFLPVLSFRKIILSKAKESFVWDLNGKKYLDINSGQFCSVFGHSNDEVAKVIKKISHTIQHSGTITLSKSIIEAANLIKSTFPKMKPRTIFLATGSEAMECCLRYAKHLKEKPGIMSFKIGYHGLTHGTAAYSMSRDKIRPTVRYSYKINVPNWKTPENSNKKIYAKELAKFKKDLLKNKKNIAAVVVEPIISGGGFYFPPKNFLKLIQKICKKNKVFLVFDECQTGFGRTGDWFYSKMLGIVPDFIVGGKSVGLGFPVACVMANGKTINHKKFILEHFSSHQNEPFAGELVKCLILGIKKHRLLKKNKKKGEIFLSRLKKLSLKFPEISNPRGVGLMLAFDLKQQKNKNSKDYGEEFCKEALNFNLMLQHCNYGKTIRLLPNYFVKDTEINFFFEKMNSLLLYRKTNSL